MIKVLFVVIVGTLILVGQSFAQIVSCQVSTRQTDVDGRSIQVDVPVDLEFCTGETPPVITTVAPITDTPTITRTSTARPITNTVTLTRTMPPTATIAITPTPNGLNVIVPDQFSTINAAIAASAPGGTVLVKAGTYAERVGIDKNGLTVKAFGNGPVWIDHSCNSSIGLEGIRIVSNDVTIDGIGIRNVGRGILVRGITDDVRPARITITNSDIRDFLCTDTGNPYIGDQSWAAIAFWYAGPGHRVTNNRITRRVLIAGTQIGLNNGIWFKSDNARPSGGGHVITDNVIVGGYDGIGGETEDHGPGSFHRDTLIARNHVSQCYDDGIQSEGGNITVRIEDNVVMDCNIGIAIAPNLQGPLFIGRNHVESHRATRTDVQACMKVGNNGSGFAYVTGNTCIIKGTADGLGDGIKQTNTGLQGFIFTDNVIDVSRYVYEFSGAMLPGSTMNDTCLASSDPARFIKYGNEQYGSLAEFQAAARAAGLDFQQLASPGPC